eukprot:TRINITY_DN2173_c0_g1_i1.p1 TRINITY_DN2173_c0_g1~~TRINITY_DN2173_c0_g1_i1.p1  ORF type:complete len:463 (-),score=78.29 TRINITY_DN2173_c0_g1_i1:138-1526(-)
MDSSLALLQGSKAALLGGSQANYVFAWWNLIIRPPRLSYSIDQLGPAEFEVGGVKAVRKDLSIKTRRGTTLACSHFLPQREANEALRRYPVVVYLHGNSSSRLEALNIVGGMIAARIAVFCFDASGCGHSDGAYVSLGWHERDDLATVVEYLRKSPFCGPVGLWGRSMGAVTVLLHADRDPSLGALCLDSPFANFTRLAEEMTSFENTALPVPRWLVKALLEVARARVRVLAGFDVEDVSAKDHVRGIFVPALFMHGREDNFISPVHSRDLYNGYAGDKELIAFAGDHNSERGPAVVHYAVSFFRRALRADVEDWTVPEHILDIELEVPEVDGRPRCVPKFLERGEATGLRARRSSDEASHQRERTVPAERRLSPDKSKADLPWKASAKRLPVERVVEPRAELFVGDIAEGLSDALEREAGPFTASRLGGAKTNRDIPVEEAKVKSTFRRPTFPGRPSRGGA